MKKITIVVIAHNEQDFIEKCLRSILFQTMEAYQIIVVIHNSTDKTREIVIDMAKDYSVIKPVIYNDNPGSVHARLEGLRHITDDDEIVLNIDGDSYAKPNWIETMTKTLESNDNVLVGSLVNFKGTFMCFLFNIMHWFMTSAKNKAAIQWIWGGSYGYKIKNKSEIKQLLLRSIYLHSELKLSTYMDDYIRAYYMNEIGNIQVTRKTSTTAHVKEVNDDELKRRHKSNLKNISSLDNYFLKNSGMNSIFNKK